MRSMNLLIGALLAAAPVLVAPDALAVIEPEPCGSSDIPGDSDCEVVTGGGCGLKCDACDMSESCQESCSSECDGKPNKVACLASCIPDCALDLAASCAAGCSGDGALFCDGAYIAVEDLGVCVEYLCTIGMDLGASCGGGGDPGCGDPDCGQDAVQPAEPAGDSVKSEPQALVGFGDPYSASKPDLPACAAADGQSEMSRDGLFAMFVGAGLFVARRRRR